MEEIYQQWSITNKEKEDKHNTDEFLTISTVIIILLVAMIFIARAHDEFPRNVTTELIPVIETVGSVDNPYTDLDMFIYHTQLNNTLMSDIRSLNTDIDNYYVMKYNNDITIEMYNEKLVMIYASLDNINTQISNVNELTREYDELRNMTDIMNSSVIMFTETIDYLYDAMLHSINNPEHDATFMWKKDIAFDMMVEYVILSSEYYMYELGYVEESI